MYTYTCIHEYMNRGINVKIINRWDVLEVPVNN